MWKRFLRRASCLLGDHDWQLVGNVCATTGTGTFRCSLCGQYKTLPGGKY